MLLGGAATCTAMDPIRTERQTEYRAPCLALEIHTFLASKGQAMQEQLSQVIKARAWACAARLIAFETFLTLQIHTETTLDFK